MRLARLDGIPPLEQAIAAPTRPSAGHCFCTATTGTRVTYGTDQAVLVAAGANTELGKIATLLEEGITLATPMPQAFLAGGFSGDAAPAEVQTLTVITTVSF